MILACGFVIVFETNEDAQIDVQESGRGGSIEEERREEEKKGEKVEEGFAILHEDADLEPIQAAIALLQQKFALAAAPQAAAQQKAIAQPPAAVAAPPAAPQATAAEKKERDWAPPCDRKTQIILPVSIDTDVPSWFFERTGQELKASFLAAVRKREQSQILMTKALREKMAKNGGSIPSSSQAVPVPTVATVKVRLPEGISLQGEFSAGEPVAVVFAFVADALADPLQTFDLVLPDRRVLEFNTKAATGSGSSSTGSVKPGSAAAIYQQRAAERPSSIKEAGLMPSVTLNLRWTGPSAVEMKGIPALRRELYTV